MQLHVVTRWMLWIVTMLPLLSLSRSGRLERVEGKWRTAYLKDPLNLLNLSNSLTRIPRKKVGAPREPRAPG